MKARQGAWESLYQEWRRMDRRVNEYLAWLDKQFRQALDAADFDAQYGYQEGCMVAFDRAEAAFRDILGVKEK